MEYRVMGNQHISQDYLKLVLDISMDGKIHQPGQFYNIRCSDTKDPLLRRPFSMHRLQKTGDALHLEILYQVIGKGTEWLSKRQKGEGLDVIGPLGNGFIMEYQFPNIILVAGGIGIAPLYAIGEAFRMNHRSARLYIVMGARLKESVFYEEECQRIGELFVCTEDGGKGFHGKAPELLVHLFESKRLPEDFYVYACGPDRMLKELSDLSTRYRFQGQLAMECHMVCGFGVCLSCTCPLRPRHIRRNAHWKKPALQWSEDGNLVYSLVCKDGPVYDIQEVDWYEWLA
jgi:dihydroorotate dehydrogenase electron transfer subunit